LAEYGRIHGHTNVNKRETEYTHLGHFVYAQRKNYQWLLDIQNGKRPADKPSPMTQERIDKLEAIGFQWRLRPSRYKKRSRSELEEESASSDNDEQGESDGQMLNNDDDGVEEDFDELYSWLPQHQQEVLMRHRLQEADTEADAMEAEAATAKRIAQEAQQKARKARQKAQRIAAKVLELQNAGTSNHSAPSRKRRVV